MSTPQDQTWHVRVNRTVAFDDALTARLRCCSACTRPTTQREGVWIGQTASGPLAVAFPLCERCAGRLQASAGRLDTRWRQRYGVEKDDATQGIDEV